MPITSLGGINHYNGFVFNDFTATAADIEGPLAVKGNMNAPAIAGGFTVAGALSGAFNIIGSTDINRNQPALLLEGVLSKNPLGRLTIQSPGIAAITPTSDPNNILNRASSFPPYITSAQLIDNVFAQALTDITPLIVNSAMYYTNKPAQGHGIGIGPAANGQNIYVSHNFNGSSPNWHIGTVMIPTLAPNDILIIYSDALEVTFNQGAIFYNGNIIDTSKPQNPILFNLCPRVVWIFPHATSITVTGYGVVGSVIALNATIDTKGGNINGQVFTKNLIQNAGFEVHNFILNWRNIYNHVPATTTSSTTSSTTGSTTSSTSSTSSSSTSSTSSSSTSSTSSSSTSSTSSSSSSSTSSSSSSSTSSSSSSSTTSSSSSSTTSSSSSSSTSTVSPTGTIHGRVGFDSCITCPGCCGECEVYCNTRCLDSRPRYAKDIRVDLFEASDPYNPIEITTTSAQGEYVFTQLPPGSYYVKIFEPCGLYLIYDDHLQCNQVLGDVYSIYVRPYSHYDICSTIGICLNK